MKTRTRMTTQVLSADKQNPNTVRLQLVLNVKRDLDKALIEYVDGALASRPDLRIADLLRDGLLRLRGSQDEPRRVTDDNIAVLEAIDKLAERVDNIASVIHTLQANGVDVSPALDSIGAKRERTPQEDAIMSALGERTVGDWE